MEQVVQERAGKIETVVLRAPEIYGPRQPFSGKPFFETVRDGKAVLAGDGSIRRSLVYIDNLCQALLRAAAVGGARGNTYWIADRRPYSAGEIVDTVEHLLEGEFGQPCAHRRRRVPAVVRAAARAVDGALDRMGRCWPGVRELAESDQAMACSAARAEKALGYRPIIELEEGMRRAIRAWLRSAEGS